MKMMRSAKAKSISGVTLISVIAPILSFRLNVLAMALKESVSAYESSSIRSARVLAKFSISVILIFD